MRTQQHQQYHRITPTLPREEVRSEYDACESLRAGAERFNRARADDRGDPLDSFDWGIPADWSIV